MSGGRFNYKQFVLNDIADNIESYIHGKELDDDDIEYYCKYCDKEIIKYIKENKRTIPNEYNYSKDTLAYLNTGINILRQAFIYANSIDKLLSGDYGEESFKNNLEINLLKLNSKE